MSQKRMFMAFEASLFWCGASRAGAARRAEGNQGEKRIPKEIYFYIHKEYENDTSLL